MTSQSEKGLVEQGVAIEGLSLLLDVRRPRAHIHPERMVVQPLVEIGGLFDEDGGEFRIRRLLGKLQNCGRLPEEISLTKHDAFSKGISYPHAWNSISVSAKYMQKRTK